MGSRASDKNNRVLCQNRKARHLYAFEETLEAGLVLTGSEVKSLRAGHASLVDGHVEVKGGEAFLVHVQIEEYPYANLQNHEPRRRRKLLLHKREIAELEEAIATEGRTAVPLELYTKEGRVKVRLGIGRGKKLHDKRQDLKDRDAEREMDRARKR
jgi:SsrA-binding protein